MNELSTTAYQRWIEQYAVQYNVCSTIHEQDFIFQFLINNPSFQSKQDAVRYYFEDGMRSAEKLRSLLQETLRFETGQKFRLLEFACGYGCVTRHLKNVLSAAEIVACDIHSAANEFISKEIGISTLQSKDLPEEFNPQEEYDVVFALSFFSHMPDASWGRWLKSLFACVRKGGLLIFTTQGLESRKYFGSPKLSQEGFWFRADSEQKDLDVNLYGQMIVTPAYAQKKVAEFLGVSVALYEAAYWWNHQDLFVVYRPGPSDGVRSAAKSANHHAPKRFLSERTERSLEQIEKIAKSESKPSMVLTELRQLPFDDFASFLFYLPNLHFPALSRLLPKMASNEVQKIWTGADGDTLLKQSIAFVGLLREGYLKYCGGDLRGRKILDFGCGYGRHLRLMYYFSDPDLLYGCDPWDQSIHLCRSDGLRSHLAISDYLLGDLPFSGQKFDVIYSFSVFTHLSKRAAHAALDALRRRITADGLLVLTIRPITFWKFHQGLEEMVVAELEEAHREDGFAFQPHNRPPIDGDITFGDTSISFDYIQENFSGWKMVGSEQQTNDQFQIVVFLRPK